MQTADNPTLPSLSNHATTAGRHRRPDGREANRGHVCDAQRAQIGYIRSVRRLQPGLLHAMRAAPRLTLLARASWFALPRHSRAPLVRITENPFSRKEWVKCMGVLQIKYGQIDQFYENRLLCCDSAARGARERARLWALRKTWVLVGE